jgi:hypothetical protein
MVKYLQNYGGIAMKTLDETLNFLKENVELCEFVVTEDEQKISFSAMDSSYTMNPSSFNHHMCFGTIGIIPAKTDKELSYFYLTNTPRSCNFYFKDENELLGYLDSEIMAIRKHHNSVFETFFNKISLSFSASYHVKNGDSTVFTNVVVLNHAKNSFFKALFGRNKYLKIFVSAFHFSNTITYCVSLFENEKEDRAICSSDRLVDLPDVLRIALKNIKQFEI